GFAVVADEVRKLAEKTMEATKQVDEAVGGIRSSMRVSAEGVSRTSETVLATVELGVNAQNSLADIVTLVQGMNEQIHDIARLCSEQAETSNGVAGTVDRLRQSSILVTEAMDEGAAITRALEPEARELGLLVEQLMKK
ncbi:methyl-accepting chemotaxis protein, partial [Desulfovibrio sp. OttesenSCG-928-O18]|nr:methyl-accepting chemotaxis protein [Desulfovibrio sp. OttesenSCG-928-O18]